MILEMAPQATQQLKLFQRQMVSISFSSIDYYIIRYIFTINLRSRGVFL